MIILIISYQFAVGDTEGRARNVNKIINHHNSLNNTNYTIFLLFQFGFPWLRNQVYITKIKHNRHRDWSLCSCGMNNFHTAFKIANCWDTLWLVSWSFIYAPCNLCITIIILTFLFWHLVSIEQQNYRSKWLSNDVFFKGYMRAVTIFDLIALAVHDLIKNFTRDNIKCAVEAVDLFDSDSRRLNLDKCVILRIRIRDDRFIFIYSQWGPMARIDVFGTSDRWWPAEKQTSWYFLNDMSS